MTAHRAVRPLLLAVAVCASASCGGGALATGAELGAFLASLQQVRTQVSETINGLDTVAQNRLRQVDISLQARIKQLDDAAKGNIQMAAAEQERMFENVFITLNELGHALEATPREAFISLNATLANVATLADALPFVDLKPAIFVADPVVHDPDSANRQVSFYGYFPDTNDGEATAQLNGASYPLKRFPGQLAFDLPAETLKDDSKFLEMTVTLKKKGWLSYFSAAPTYHHRIYLRARKPYSVVVTSYQTHPELWADVTPPKEFKRTADSTTQSNNGQETSSNIYVELGGDTTAFDQSSALINGAATALGTPSSRPCDSCCPGTTQGYKVSDDGTTLSWNLHAPNCPAKGSGCPGIFDSCGGGGSNANVIGRVAFRVKKRGVPDEKELENRTFQMGREDVANQSFGAVWTQVKIVATYLDGDYPVKVAGAVTRARSVESNNYLTIEADKQTGDVQVRTHKK